MGNTGIGVNTAVVGDDFPVMGTNFDPAISGFDTKFSY